MKSEIGVERGCPTVSGESRLKYYPRLEHTCGTPDYVEHYHSLDAWRKCLNMPRVGELVADERRIQSACSLMFEGKGEIFVSLLRRLG